MSEKLLSHPAALCNMVRRIATEAGRITLEYFDESGYQGAETKGDGSPVTIADREAEAHIEQALREILPDIPVVGEEAVEQGRIPDLSGVDCFWLVDPLDGTKEFIAGSGDFTVNIGLIRDGAPVLGVVYAPALGELYAGHGPGTAVRLLEDTGKEKPIHVRRPPAKGLTVVVSRSHGSDGRTEDFLKAFKVAKIVKRGSSLKICSIAAGKADLYPRFGLTCEWDTAAAEAVLSAAGGIIRDPAGRPLAYGKSSDGFSNGDFVASGMPDPGIFSGVSP